MKAWLEGVFAEALGAIGAEIPEGGIPFEKPKQEDHGDLSTSIALQLARPLKQNPRAIAQRIVDALVLDPQRIAAVEIAGAGFINLRYSDAYLRNVVTDILDAGADYGRSTLHAGKTVNVEWVSANPTGPLHAGHGRQVCLGATLCNVLEWTGWTVTREYYFNNAGNQMQNLGLSVRERYRQLLGLPIDEENIQYVGEYIRDIAAEIHDEFGDGKKDEEVSFFTACGERWCFARIRATLDRLGVRHDLFFNESSLYADGKIREVLDILAAKDLTYELDGATWLRATAFGADKDRVIVKSTGEPTYRLPDIAYHRDKILRGYDRIVDIFGADHIATIPDVLNGVRSLGLSADHVDVIIHQMVSFVNDGEVVKMSKRSGNVYYLDDLITDVGADVVRYFFVMRGANAHLEFDLKLAREESDTNPVYYLQYAHARIASIIRHADREGVDAAAPVDLARLGAPEEFSLLRTLMDFPSVIHGCATSSELHPLCNYLHGVATAFHKFYHECRVVSDDAALTAARIALCRATRQVLANGLGLLGISAPEQM